MSYDLAVWEGPRPSSDEEAAGEFDRLMGEMEDAHRPASPAIKELAAELVTRWPELGEAGEEECSCLAGGSLIQDASGEIICFAMRSDRVVEAVPFIAEVASRRGLVCYDPQEEALR